MPDNVFDFSTEAEATNKALADEIAALAPLTPEQLVQILPEQIDQENFERLKAIIDSSTNEQEKLAMLKDNFSNIGGVVGKLLLQSSPPRIGGVVVNLLGKLINPLA